ncbi:hypothetical protein QFZ99_006059 [Paraburkholderia atlantica]|uniref:hypothetical protein n=1 Tax=Paraburkholderia atlantica TaxID=2654982 RepID=UPI003D194A19
MNTIFVDTPTALHVSLLILALPVREPSALRRALIRMLECMPVRTYQQSATLARLIGTRSLTVDFTGLTTPEIHAQCSMIVDAVERRLPRPEFYAMLARFAPTEAVKAIGVEGLMVWLAPAAPISNCAALTSLIWRRYVPKKYRDGYSLRAIAQQTGSSKSTLGRVAQWLDDESAGLELRALRRLEETFVPHQVCGAMAMQS